MVYAIVKAGGRQEKVSVGDTLIIDKTQGEIGDTITLSPVMLVDGDELTTDADKLEKTSVKAEIIDEKKAKKIRILKFKNKTGYRRRMGHRQQHSVVKVTEIA